jgi:broad specificity phosphatase PhoE
MKDTIQTCSMFKIMPLNTMSFKYYFLLLVFPSTQGFFISPTSCYHHGLFVTPQHFETDLPLSRRNALQAALISSYVACGFHFFIEPALADLIQFPITYPLKNTYHFMRAGESLLESQDIMSTNPLFLTNREDALSPNGVNQVQEACRYLVSQDVNPSLVKFSLAAKCIDTANIVASEMQVGRDKLIPEYTFMDPRGIGKWDRRPISTVESALFAMDEMETRNLGQGGRPPKNDDGTADETLGDQIIRLRELMSLCEGHCSGDTILLIFGDGTGPALLTALITGFPLQRVHEIEYNAGEVRLDINKDPLASFPTEKSKAYLSKIREGQASLETLRNEEKILANQEAQEKAERKEFKEKRHERALQLREQANIDRQSLERPKAMDFQFNTLSAISVGSVATIISSVLSSKEITDENILMGEEDDAATTNSSNNDDIQIAPELQKSADQVSRSSVVSPKEITDENTMIEEENNAATTNNGISNDDIQTAPELQKLADLVSQASFTIPEIANKEKEERARIAQEAMNEYMNRDDGGEAFIDFVSDLLHED